MKEKEKPIKSFKGDKTITILPADKGRTTDVMDTDTDEKQMETMLERRKEKDFEITTKTTTGNQQNNMGRIRPFNTHSQ